MNNRRIDFNLLVILDAVTREKSVTRASNALGISQPAVSAAIGRLRELVGDPLFTRTNYGVMPTPRARQLAGPIEEALSLVRRAIQGQSSFDPATSDRTFKILMMDIGEMNLLPRLLGHVRDIAPNLALETNQTLGEAQVASLESGDSDVAVGYWPHLTAQRGFYQRHLFTDSFVACWEQSTRGPAAE